MEKHAELQTFTFTRFGMDRGVTATLDISGPAIRIPLETWRHLTGGDSVIEVHVRSETGMPYLPMKQGGWIRLYQQQRIT